MKESIGSTYLITLIIIFLVIIFAILASTLTYYKAYKVNTKIINSLEKFEGYNDLAKREIGNNLNSIGYLVDDNYTCPRKNGQTALANNSKYRYCVYYYEDEGEKYYSYGVTTYITLDIPMFSLFLKIPIYTKSNRIYYFTGS